MVYRVDLLDQILNHSMKVLDDDVVRNLRELQNARKSKRASLAIFLLIRPVIKLLYGFIRHRRLGSDVNYKYYDWVIVNDHGGHSEVMIKGLIREFSDTSKALFLTCNVNLSTPHETISFALNSFTSVGIRAFVRAVIYSYSRKSNIHTHWYSKSLYFLTTLEKAAKIIEAYRFYSMVEFSDKAKLISLCDSHWHQSVLTHIFNDRELSTFTCVHGAPANWEIFCPFVSDYVLSWGSLMTNSILKHSPEMSLKRIIEVGNFKFKHQLEKGQVDLPNLTKIDEVVFISPCYNLNDQYGFSGLKQDIDSFMDLDLGGLRKAIRPYPCFEEIEFIEALVEHRGKRQDINIITDANFLELVKPSRLFVGHVSTAISDVIMSGGLFIGVNSNKINDIILKMIFYSPEIYLEEEELEAFIKSLKIEKNLTEFQKRMSKFKELLNCKSCTKIDKKLIHHDSLNTKKKLHE